MSKPHLFKPPSDDEPAPPADGVPDEGHPAADVEQERDPLASVEPRHATTRLKLAEGARGIKLAIRAESGFFAHAYRGLLIAITAAILGVSPTGWCFLIVSAALVLTAEAFRCALITSVELFAEPGDPRARIVREMASGGLLFASITSGCLTITVLSAKLGEMLGW
jgi:diacylglycerol kinase